jgi:hypothetical protein
MRYVTLGTLCENVAGFRDEAESTTSDASASRTTQQSKGAYGYSTY